MSYESQLGFAASLAISLIGLWAVVYYIYRPSVVATFREEIFSMRRELFQLMADGKIAPTHPAYTRLRWTMNGVLRFAERFGLGQAILIYAFCPKSDSPGMEKLIGAVSDAETRAKLSELSYRMGAALLKHLLTRSIFVLLTASVFVIVAVAIYVTTRGVNSLVRELGRRGEPLAEKISDKVHRECTFATA